MERANTRLLIMLEEMKLIAVADVERLARVVLFKNGKKLNEFVMFKGIYFFTNSENEFVYDYIADNLVGFEQLKNFIDRWDGMLKMTDHTMRFTAKGETITEWDQKSRKHYKKRDTENKNQNQNSDSNYITADLN